MPPRPPARTGCLAGPVDSSATNSSGRARSGAASPPSLTALVGVRELKARSIGEVSAGAARSALTERHPALARPPRSPEVGNGQNATLEQVIADRQRCAVAARSARNSTGSRLDAGLSQSAQVMPRCGRGSGPSAPASRRGSRVVQPGRRWSPSRPRCMGTRCHRHASSPPTGRRVTGPPAGQDDRGAPPIAPPALESRDSRSRSTDRRAASSTSCSSTGRRQMSWPARATARCIPSSDSCAGPD